MKIIYCDGSSLGNPGRGGWGVVAIDTEKKIFWEYGGSDKNVTNNQMELAACLAALKIILKSSDNISTEKNVAMNRQKKVEYELRLDSKYVIQGVTEWSKNWQKNGWKNAQKKEVVNKEIWKEILSIKKQIEEKNVHLKWTHVYGHTGEMWNERVDVIAKSFAGGEEIVLAKAVKFE